jgi:hypothetical protein
MYGNRIPPDEPPCETCRVDLLGENYEAAEIYIMCRNQVITAGMGEIVDINLQTVKTVMDLYGVKNQRECMEKVSKTFRHFLNKRRDEQN